MARPKSFSGDIDITTPRFRKKEFKFPLLVPEKSGPNATKAEIALLERVKELNCLYGMAKLAERHSDSIEDFLHDLVEILPPSWQYPEITCARIVFNEKTYKSQDFKISKWRQSARILTYNEPSGEVEVFYLEEKPAECEGPFLREERLLLGAVAEQIGKIAVRISAERELRELNKQLTVERQALQEANAALRTVLSRIEDEKNNIYRNIHENVEKILMPVLHALSMELPRYQKKYIEILRTNMEEITSPFTSNLSRNFYSLTPTEIKICNLIRSGMRTKEIAQVQHVSTATVNRHREHIRKKLGIANKDINLATYLQSSMWDDDNQRVANFDSPSQD